MACKRFRRAEGTPQPSATPPERGSGRGAMRQAACKPGSVLDATSCVARRVAVIHLGRRLPAASSDLPGDGPGRAIASLFGLAPSGACSAGRSPDRWCALTAPSHPYRRPHRSADGLAVCFCALSVSSRCLGVTQRPVPWSPDFPRSADEPKTATARRPGEIHCSAVLWNQRSSAWLAIASAR